MPALPIPTTMARLLLYASLGTAIVPAATAALPRATPEQEGFSPEGLARVDALIQDSVDRGFPGAVLAVARNGRLVKLSAYGDAINSDEHGPLATPQPMRTDTLFDLASNTKLYATTYALQRLVWQGRIDPDAPVAHYLPGFVDGPDDAITGKAGITVAQLLAHTAGTLANPRYYDRAAMGPLFAQDRQSTWASLLRTPLVAAPDTRTVYSDFNFMLLGLLIETVSGQQLDAYLEQEIYAPLGVRALFAPLRPHPRLPALAPSDFAATELRGNTRDGGVWFENIRTRTVRGEVHDEKAFHSLEQVAGHAGLFADAESVAVLMQPMLTGGRHGRHQLFDQATIERFTAQASPLDPGFGLGWNRNRSRPDDKPKFFGAHASPRAIGHTGWTGTATVIDPEHGLAIVLLTNKKHSRVIDPAGDSNRFVGDTYPISLYRAVIDQVYLAMQPAPAAR